MSWILQETTIISCLCETIEILFLLFAQFTECNCDQMHAVLVEKLFYNLLCVLICLLTHFVRKVYYVSEIISCILLGSTIWEDHLLATFYCMCGCGWSTPRVTILAFLEFLHCLNYCFVHISVLSTRIWLDSVNLISQLSEILLLGDQRKYYPHILRKGD